MKSKASAFFVLLKGVTSAKGKKPVRLVIYDGKKRKRYGIGISLSEEAWDKLSEPKLKDSGLKKIRSELNAIRVRAEDLISELTTFSFEEFEMRFFEKKSGTEEETIKVSNLKVLFQQYIDEKKSNEQVGTYKSYETTINSIEAFKPNISIYEVTTAFLMEYEKHLTSKGNSPTTIGIYMRQLRAVVNRAIKNGILDIKDYPFRNYQIPTSRNIKQALTEEELIKIYNYTSDNKVRQRAVDFWLFSYLCNGMNFTDIAHLKKDSITGNYLNFVRQKTKRTKKKDLTPIRVALLPKAKEILEKYKNNEEGNPFLFSILEQNLSPLTMKHRCHRFYTNVNKQMKIIGAELLIENQLNTYSARHTFSTFLKRKGVSTSYIKEALGHSSEATTESYLASFTDDVKLKYASLLTEFQVKTEVNVVESDTPKKKKTNKS